MHKINWSIGAPFLFLVTALLLKEQPPEGANEQTALLAVSAMSAALITGVLWKNEQAQHWWIRQLDWLILTVGCLLGAAYSLHTHLPDSAAAFGLSSIMLTIGVARDEQRCRKAL